MAVTWKALAYAADVMANTVADANSILYAVTDNTPAALPLAANTFPARSSTGNILAKAITDFGLSLVDDADAATARTTLGLGTMALETATNYILKSLVDAAGDLLVGSGADTIVRLAKGADNTVLTVVAGSVAWQAPASVAPLAHASTHKSGGSDSIRLDEFAAPTAAVAFNGQQATNLIIHVVADSTALNALTPVVGKLAWRTDTLAPYVCTSAV